MRQWNFEKLSEELLRDTLVYGQCFVTAHWRKWWNPMRLLFGKIKLVRLDPEKFYRDFPEARTK